MSVMPPGAHGTTIVTGRVGHDCAAAGIVAAKLDATNRTAPTTNCAIRAMSGSPPLSLWAWLPVLRLASRLIRHPTPCRRLIDRQAAFTQGGIRQARVGQIVRLTL